MLNWSAQDALLFRKHHGQRVHVKLSSNFLDVLCLECVAYLGCLRSTSNQCHLQPYHAVCYHVGLKPAVINKPLAAGKVRMSVCEAN